MSINLYSNPDEAVAAKRKSRFIEEPKIFATKTPRHKDTKDIFIILSWCLGDLVAEWKKFCQKKHKIQF